ncbi:hypothetical protein ACIGO8_07960 [Streptomyces sp. NPDC053493]|uniref:hypothetical protein n=1 Tax=Streptomyces sp. NPDC053493 TaxID=3365705 RepID=UPI0037D56012
MDALKAALARRDLLAARAARSAAWDEVAKLADNLTQLERRELWKCKILIRSIEKARRNKPGA